MARVINISKNTRFAYFFKSMFFEELLKFPNPQTITFGWNVSELKTLPTLLVSYYHIVIKVLRIWAKLLTHYAVLDLFVIQIYVFVRITKILKPTNKSVWLKMKPTQKVTNIVSKLPTYFDKGINNLGQLTVISCNTRSILYFKSILF